jgi:hypothetical protein
MLRNLVAHCYFQRLHAQQICRASSVVGGHEDLGAGQVSDMFVAPLSTATADLLRAPDLTHRRCVTAMKFPG